MPMCSGVTCQYREPRNRYDIFVEAVNQDVAAFSGHLAVDMVGNVIAHGSLDTKYKDIIELAKVFSKNPQLVSSIKEIPNQGGFPLDALGSTVNDLVRLQYF